MQYMMMFYENETAFAKREDKSESNPYWGAWYGYLGAMREAGVIVNGDGLQPPSTSTTVRMVDGERLVQDGPAAATREQLGGYLVIEVAGLDEALSWAARSPSSSGGATEVRPVMVRQAAM